MDIELFDYDLPEELIAQTPAKVRDECRLLCIDKKNDKKRRNNHNPAISRTIREKSEVIKEKASRAYRITSIPLSL